MRIAWHPSPNFSDRRGGFGPQWVVLHYTAMWSADEAIERLCAPEYEVSAHYVIDERGQVTQLVDDAHRAWHAGQSYWRGLTDMNSASIGIELCNRGDHPFPWPQIDAMQNLLNNIMNRWSIPRSAILGHSDIALGRKTDPGARFDWRGLARAGFGPWPIGGHAPVDAAEFLTNAGRFGYDTEVGLDRVVAAFRLRFAPYRSGPLDADDCAEMASLARQMAVDPVITSS